MKILQTAELKLRSWLSRRALFRDPTYRGLIVLEADMRRRHLNASSVRAAKSARLHDMLRGAR